jgi:hypothetical protein
VCEGQLNGFPNLLLLHVQASDIGICDIGLLVLAKHGDGRVGLRWQDVNKGIRVAVEGDG